MTVSEDDPTATVQVITWGRHMASNAFADIPNVILAGTLFMRDSQNTALTHLAQGRSVREGFRPKDEVSVIVRGEHAHHILQALCRGRVRQLDGARCRDMNAYIIASERSGIADLIPNIFPGCKVGVWRRDNRLTGKLGEAVAWLEKEALTGNCKVSYRSIQEAINVTSKNFAKLVTGHDAWNTALAGIGWQPDREQRARNLIRTSRT